MSIFDATPRLLLLHVPGADWRIAQGLVDAGVLPHLSSVIDGGVIGNLFARPPHAYPTLTTTLATGMPPHRHQALSMLHHDETNHALRPTCSFDLAMPPLWQRVAALGGRSGAVGWPISHPATVADEAEGSVVISELFGQAVGESFGDWPLADQSVSDHSLRETLAELRLHPTEVTAEMVAPFFNRPHEIDQETDPRMAALMVVLARAASMHAAGTYLAEQCELNLLAVHFDFIERLSQIFMPYRAPTLTAGHAFRSRDI